MSLLMVAIVIIIIIVILCVGSIIDINNTSELSVVKREIPPHQFMTREPAGLVVHYMSTDAHSLIRSSSRLKMWYFDRFHRSGDQNRDRITVVMFARSDDIHHYDWLIQLCGREAINLAIISTERSYISELRLASNWLNRNIILITDADPELLVEFKKSNDSYRTVDDNSIYRAIIVLCQTTPITSLPHANRIIIVKDYDETKSTISDRMNDELLTNIIGIITDIKVSG